MRTLFPEYYRPTGVQLGEMWREAIFAFDASALLHIYRFDPDGRGQLFAALRHLQDRLWVPHQAALEFQRNRITVINEQLQVYDEVREVTDKLRTEWDKFRSSRKYHQHINLEQLDTVFNGGLKEIRRLNDEAQSRHPDLLRTNYSTEQDTLRQRLDELLEGKVGAPYPQDRLDRIYEEGKKRYQQRIPPGYMDDEGKNKKPFPNNFGDLVLWYQLIDHADSMGKPLIFVSDDRKEDWWEKAKGKTYGPRTELVAEMLAKAKVGFHIYNADQYLKYVKDSTNIDTDKASYQARETLRQIEASRHRTPHMIEPIRHVVVTSGTLGTKGHEGGGWELNGNGLSLTGSTTVGTTLEQQRENRLDFRCRNTGLDIWLGTGVIDGRRYEPMFYEGELKFSGSVEIPQEKLHLREVTVEASFTFEGFLNGCTHGTSAGCPEGYVFSAALVGSGIVNLNLYVNHGEERRHYGVISADYYFQASGNGAS